MANLLDADFMLWTGDSTPHDIWKQHQQGKESIFQFQHILIFVLQSNLIG